MYQSEMSRDIATTVHHALQEHFERRTDAGSTQYSDGLLARLPRSSGSSPTTTAALLRRYQIPLQQALCQNKQPRFNAATREDELSDLTRAVLVTVGATEGISIEAAVGIALVLYKRGVAPFCAIPSR
jgi:hypothetical protein